MSDKVGNLWVVEHYVVLSPEFWLQKLGRVNGGFEASRIIKRNKGLSRLSHPVGSTPPSRLTAEDVTIIRQSPLLLASLVMFPEQVIGASLPSFHNSAMCRAVERITWP